MVHYLDYIFDPQSIAIAGVSRNSSSIGRKLLKNILDYNYKGKISIIHPKIDDIEGIKAYKNLVNIPFDVDLLISIVKRDYVMDLLKDAREKKVKSLIIITAGFKEIDEEGALLEEKVLQFTREAGIRVIGPNSMGIFNGYGNRVNASFTPIMPKSGFISFISQSGAIGAVLMGYCRDYGLGFSKFVSVGNKMDININHLLPYLQQDKNTKIITAYLESFSDPKNFVKIANKVAREKPILVVKSGRTERGSIAASSHTGALASVDNFVDIVLKKNGIIRVDTIKELIDTSLIFVKSPLPKGNRVAVISNAGGPGTLATDSLIRNGFAVNNPSPHIEEQLRSILPLEASTNNPIDILPSAGLDGYEKTVELCLKDEIIDLILVLFLPPVMVDVQDQFLTIEKIAKAANKPIIACFMGDHGEIKEFGSDLHFPIYPYPEVAAKMMRYFYEYSMWLESVKKLDIESTSSFENQITNSIISNAKLRDNLLLQDEIHKILKSYGMSFPKSNIVSSKDELLDTCENIGFPVVIKIASKYISHKSDSGGVFLNISNNKMVNIAWNKILNIYDENNIPNSDRQILVQKYYTGGVEIALGGTNDPQFGQMLMVGSGGVAIELWSDVVFQPVPVNEKQAEEMLKNLKGYKLLKGFRGSKISNISALKKCIVSLSKLLENNPCIIEMDINPLFVMPEGEPIVIDARMSINK